MKRGNNFNMQSISDNIRQIREKLNYTQEYLAYKLNISQNAYSKIELGYTKLTLARFFDICSILEADASELLNSRKEAA
jgi:transcriptional regulator with XRE-family HTH domain